LIDEGISLENLLCIILWVITMEYNKKQNRYIILQRSEHSSVILNDNRKLYYNKCILSKFTTKRNGIVIMYTT